MESLSKVLNEITGADRPAQEKAQERLNNLLKPVGSLGKLENIVIKMSGITGNIYNNTDKKAIIVMAADNGVTKEGVASFPKEITTLVAECMSRGISGVSVLAASVGADVKVIDLGIDGEVAGESIVNKKIRKSTGNIKIEPAMSQEETIRAIEIGIETVDELVKKGYNLFGTGEVGIGNTTTSSACLYALTGMELDKLVGRGAGLSDEGLEKKKAVIRAAVEKHNPQKDNPIDILSKVGGLDLAGLVGCYIGAAKNRTPIVIDGFISGVAAVLAYTLKPEIRDFMIASHGSEEPGAKIIAQTLEMEPMLMMNMRLGEGTGAALAFPIIDAANNMIKNMGTFADIGM